MKFIYIVLLIPLFCLSQNKQFEYTVYYNTDSPLLKKGYLIPYLKKNKTNYYEVFSKNIFDEENNEDEITEVIMIGDKDLVKRTNIDYNDQYIYSLETITFTDSLLLVKEKIPDFNWNIKHKDTLKIGDFICNKATLDFRGRSYTAWYSTDIPLSYGPWKFSGLPGLIIEIYDNTRRYEWSLSRISNISIDEKELSKSKADSTVSLKEFITNKEKRFKKRQRQMVQNIKTRSDRGVFVSDVKITKLRTSKELIFEWEEEEEKEEETKED